MRPQQKLLGFITRTFPHNTVLVNVAQDTCFHTFTASRQWIVFHTTYQNIWSNQRNINNISKKTQHFLIVTLTMVWHQIMKIPNSRYCYMPLTPNMNTSILTEIYISDLAPQETKSRVGTQHFLESLLETNCEALRLKQSVSNT